MRRRWLGLVLVASCAACSPPPAPTQKSAAATSLHPASLPATIDWPADQLLPSFPTPAPVQDLIELQEAPQQWSAIGTQLSHNTGHLDTDGWLCQVNVDTANAYMIYGPYDTTVPAGANTAQFSMIIDNNTADNAPIVRLEVNDATANTVVASQTFTRMQFPVAATYTTLSVPFTLAADNHQLELRVFWLGAAYTKVNWVGVTKSQADDELVLFASLKGIVNATQPRIFSYEGDAFAEGPHTWLQSLGLQYTDVTDNWSLITKYRSELAGIIVYENSQPDTVNLATTLAGPKKALVVAPSLVAKLTAAPYNLPILQDLRGQFTSKLAVYQYLYDNVWPSLDHRVAIGLNPTNRAAVREYATALGVAALWLDPTQSSDTPLLSQFLSSMGAGGRWMGWWTDEGAGVTLASQYGVATIASDFSTNLTMHSGMSRTIHVKPIPPKPTLANKLYVAFILSDGDNLQYVEHLERKLWNDPGRGMVPMGWTMSPAMVDAMPGALDFYRTSATDNDCILSGPSGYGYTYPNSWTNAGQLQTFIGKTDTYEQRAGMRIITVWNTITGGINQDVGVSYADNAPSLLGLTAQNTGGGLTIYDNKLPSMALSCNYCTNEQAMKDFIASSAQGWDGNEPRFLVIQAQPWQGVTPTSFMNVAASLDSDYVVVRPDILFELLREQNGLTVNPAATYTITATAEANGDIDPSGTVTLEQNQDQAFTITPHAGYVVQHVIVDGLDTDAATSYTFTNVTADHTIDVSFALPGTPTDGGIGDAGVPGGGADGGVPGGGVDGGHGGGHSGGGCSCEMQRGPSSRTGMWSIFALLIVAYCRRRRAFRS
ncbi:MAG TPA: GxGYxYP domain-containing protein [Polyangia bacterium]|nr:GxGYxYP domain-containing protein [Polyangia bacterium]